MSKNWVQQEGAAGTHHPEEATELLKGTVMSFVRPSSLGWSGFSSWQLELAYNFLQIIYGYLGQQKF